MLKKILPLALSCVAGVSSLCAEDGWITVDSGAKDALLKDFKEQVTHVDTAFDVSIFKIDSSLVDGLTQYFYSRPVRGGFMYHESLAEAKNSLRRVPLMQYRNQRLREEYSLDQGETVHQLMDELEETRISDTIVKLSDFHTRYYNTKTGHEASQYVYDTWKTIAGDREDISVKLYEHAGMQPTPIVRIEGDRFPEDVIVIGGHIDSTAGWGGGNKRAPGADDNASGVAVMTELLRAMVAKNYFPGRTVEMMAYAAEEVGLRGSKAIARDYAAKQVNVKGVLILDMVNYKGSDVDIVFIDDFTNPAQNQFLQNLTDTYVKASWGTEACGYGCSDHAPWHNQGYPASFPFEAYDHEYNPAYHSDRDLIDICGGNSNHAMTFAKLGMAYIVELAK
jgi:leucyl aminopeptidase